MTTKPSKFQSIFEPNEDAVGEEMPLQAIAPVTEKEPAPTHTPVLKQQVSEQGGEPPRRTGRPATGKKSNPNYRQVTAYVRKDLYRNVTDALYDESRGRDIKRREFSELVDELLEHWWQVRNTQRDQSPSR